jgi:hypothetical protein
VPQKTVKRRLQVLDREFANDDGIIFLTVAKLVDALAHFITEGTEDGEWKNSNPSASGASDDDNSRTLYRTHLMASESTRSTRASPGCDSR